MDPNDQQVAEELSKININGQEYDPTEAQELIETGRRTREAETKWNTKLDTVWPEYGKSRDQIRTLETQLSEARNQLEEFNAKKEAGTETRQDLTEAREAARKLGIPLQEDIEKTYIKRDDFEKLLSERDSKRQAVDKVLSEADKLETEIDGTDGRPRFNKRAVIAYAGAYGFSDLKAAYEDMHPEVKTWKEQQIAAKKNPGLKTLNASSAKKEPNAVKVTDDNKDDLLREALWGNKE